MMTGVVEATSTKEVNTKFGPKPTYSMKVNGNWVKCGFKDPEFKQVKRLMNTSGVY